MAVYKDKTLLDNNRTLLNYQKSEIDKVLPEHILEEYPQLVKLFEYYYDWLDDSDNFGGQITRLYRNRDATQVPTKLLQYLEDELLLGQSYFGGFLNKREAIKFSNTLYRSKGTKYSIEQFFRGFYGIDPVVEYPKKDIFKVGPEIDFRLDSTNDAGEQIKEPASKIGPDSFKFITDDKKYQVLSILIRSNLPQALWNDVYKLFVHPAGFFITGETLVEMVNLSWNNQAHDPEIANNGGINFIMDEVGDPIVVTLTIAPVGEFTLTGDLDETLLATGDTDVGGSYGIHRQRTDTTFNFLNDLSIDSLGEELQLAELLSPNSVTMDDSDTAGRNTDFSMVFRDDIAVLRRSYDSDGAYLTAAANEIERLANGLSVSNSDFAFLNDSNNLGFSIGDINNTGTITLSDAQLLRKYRDGIIEDSTGWIDTHINVSTHTYIGQSTFDQGIYRTLFDSLNSADSAHYPLSHDYK